VLLKDEQKCAEADKLARKVAKRIPRVPPAPSGPAVQQLADGGEQLARLERL
jgi:hypothetical protein